jgi:putative toxin-antitoxin system antitoxin component (TIGR02293 family)
MSAPVARAASVFVSAPVLAPPSNALLGLSGWAQDINLLASNVAGTVVGQLDSEKHPPNTPANRKRRRTGLRLLSTDADTSTVGASSAKNAATAPRSFGYRMAHDVAEQLVQSGIDPDYLGKFAALSGLDPRDVLDFTGIDRTTVSRRKASGAALPQDTAVKALQVTDLVTQATEVFGTPHLASAWLTKAHPLLDGQTPLRRARTPWGLAKVQGLLVALRYGGAA